MIIQLNPPIPVWTKKGTGVAWFVTDYGIEHHLQWTVAMDDTGEIWNFKNPEVRAQKNITQGRTITDEKIHK
jgi:hypothetical protein